MADDEQVFDAIVEDTIDVNLTPRLLQSNSPRVSSGVSSHPSAACQDSAFTPEFQSSQDNTSSGSSALLLCPFPGCKKSYKTKKGFEKHIFVHEITGMHMFP